MEDPAPLPQASTPRKTLDKASADDWHAVSGPRPLARTSREVHLIACRRERLSRPGEPIQDRQGIVHQVASQRLHSSSGTSRRQAAPRVTRKREEIAGASTFRQSRLLSGRPPGSTCCSKGRADSLAALSC